MVKIRQTVYELCNEEIITGESQYYWFVRFLCFSVSLYVDIFKTQLLREFFSYLHQTYRVTSYDLKVYAYWFWEVKVKGQGHRGHIITFHIFNVNWKSCGLIFTKFQIYILQMTGIMPIAGLNDILNDARTACAQSWHFRKNILFSTVF